MNRDTLIAQLVELPLAIAAQEHDLLTLQRRALAAREALADAEGRLLLSTGERSCGRCQNPDEPESNCPECRGEGTVAGPILTGRNEAQRTAHLRYLTRAERGFVQDAEAEVAAARVELELRRNEFAALRAMSRLLAVDVAA
jgi:hypothetical protein